MSLRIRIIDAFAHDPFTGNPAAVCLLEGGRWPEEAWMRHVAAEMNLPMTAFAHPLAGSGEADWGLRWFNAVIEERLCGHATLATAHALHNDGLVRDSVRFATLSGVLPARVDGGGSITLDFPAAEAREMSVPKALADALGADPARAYDTGALRDVLLAFSDEAAVRALAPDMAALARFTTEDKRRGIIATAPAEQTGGDYHFVSRFFSPADGLPEDPVTGSTHTVLATYWSSLLGSDELTGLQVSSRTGLVRTRVDGDRVLLTGRAVTVLDGFLQMSVPLPETV